MEADCEASAQTDVADQAGRRYFPPGTAAGMLSDMSSQSCPGLGGPVVRGTDSGVHIRLKPCGLYPVSLGVLD